jgi:hypothetical protein
VDASANSGIGESSFSIFDIIQTTIRVDRGTDDAYESGSGKMNLGGKELKLADKDKTVGLRFNGLAIPPAVTILSAHVEFTAKKNHSSLTISSRPKTTASIPWMLEPWTENAVYSTPDLAALVQEIVDRQGWNSGSSLVITFSSGTAKREARAFDGDATRAPLLHVEHKIGGTALPE